MCVHNIGVLQIPNGAPSTLYTANNSCKLAWLYWEHAHLNSGRAYPFGASYAFLVKSLLAEVAMAVLWLVQGGDMHTAVEGEADSSGIPGAGLRGCDGDCHRPAQLIRNHRAAKCAPAGGQHARRNAVTHDHHAAPHAGLCRHPAPLRFLCTLHHGARIYSRRQQCSADTALRFLCPLHHGVRTHSWRQ